MHITLFAFVTFAAEQTPAQLLLPCAIDRTNISTG